MSYYCDIYVNGRLAGSHEGMWDNFSTDVSGLVKNGENELTITVWKPGYYREDRFPPAGGAVRLHSDVSAPSGASGMMCICF